MDAPHPLPSDCDALLNTVLIGDSQSIAPRLPTQFVNAIITSPPYFGHRKYADETLVQAEIGREATAMDYVNKLVRLFRELRRVLKDNGTLWLNLGDTYRDGQLLGIPWRVAFALQDDGWLLRSEVIWHKPNAMPSSVKNRPTTSHETIFLFAKQPAYFYDADAIREPHVTFSEESRMLGGRNHFGKRNGTPESGKNRGSANLHQARWDQAFHPLGRNKRTVWNIPLGKFREAHFAVFPLELAEICLLASTPEQGIALDPFIGSGTTGVVAKKHNRNFVGIELVPHYAEMAMRRIAQTRKPLF
jgi:site-specific DNA-methyltransferase (adenine-specific)